MTNLKIGSKIKIISNNHNYIKWINEILTVNHIAKSTDDHPGYDNCVGGNLISCDNFPFSLYDYEFEIIE